MTLCQRHKVLIIFLLPVIKKEKINFKLIDRQRFSSCRSIFPSSFVGIALIYSLFTYLFLMMAAIFKTAARRSGEEQMVKDSLGLFQENSALWLISRLNYETEGRMNPMEEGFKDARKFSLTPRESMIPGKK